MKDKNYKNFYDNIDRDQEYASCKNAEEHPFWPVLKATIETYGLKNKKVLEIGSGNGRFQDIVDDYSGLDISEDLQRFYHKPFFGVEDDKPYPFQDESFDLVFTNAVFEHIPNIDLALSEMIRITKRGGGNPV